jgi:type 1 glutamine amidotransferase
MTHDSLFFEPIFYEKLFLLLLILLMAVHSQAQESAIKALLITGGGWHDYETQKKLLIDGINDQVDVEIEWTVVHEGDGNPDYHASILEEKNWAEDYDVIIHNTGFGRVTDSEFVAKFVKHHYGTPAVLIHASIHSYRYAESADPWFEFMGYQSMWHEDQREFKVENIATDHPIMNDVSESWMSPPDEIYVTEKVWGEITPLLRAYGEQSDDYQTVSWTHEINNTRVFATSLGHNNETFEQEEFIKLVSNGLLWTVERL